MHFDAQGLLNFRGGNQRLAVRRSPATTATAATAATAVTAATTHNLWSLAARRSPASDNVLDLHVITQNLGGSNPPF